MNLKVRQRIFVASLSVTMIIIGIVAYYASSKSRIAKTTLTILSEKHVDELIGSLLLRVERPDQKKKLSATFDKLRLNIKNENYSDEHLNEILKFFDSLERENQIDSNLVNKFYKLVYSEF